MWSKDKFCDFYKGYKEKKKKKNQTRLAIYLVGLVLINI